MVENINVVSKIYQPIGDFPRQFLNLKLTEKNAQGHCRYGGECRSFIAVYKAEDGMVAPAETKQSDEQAL